MQDPTAEALQTNVLVWEIIKQQTADLLGGGSLEAYCKAYADEHSDGSLLQRMAAAKALAEVQPSSKARAAELILSSMQRPGMQVCMHAALSESLFPLEMQTCRAAHCCQ